jgi:PAS domain S-box-containing protein
MRTHYIYNYIPDTKIIFKIELICLFGLLPLISSFFELITVDKISKITIGYSFFSSFLMLAVIFTPSTINLDLLRIWQLSGLIMILYVFFFLICWRFFLTASHQWKRSRISGQASGRFRVYVQTLHNSAVGNLLIGSTILVGTAIYDILDSMIFQNDYVLTNYGFLIFTLGSTFIIANRFTFLNRQMNDLNHSLDTKIREVETASEKFRISEKKYRSLFEGNSDAVLLLNEDFSILEGNQAGIQLLGIHKRDLTSHSIFDSLYHKENDTDHSRDLLHLKLNELLKNGKSAELNLRFNGNMGEIKTVRIRLEIIHTLNRGRQILLRGVLIQEDSLLDYFVAEKTRYQISNSFPLTDDVSRRITANLVRYMDRGEAEILFIGIREMILNAVEHGNLNINFEEKTKAQAEDSYIEFLMERQKEPRYSQKKVTIESMIKPEKVIYRISDEGPGFDHKTFLETKRHEIDDNLAHGRGISMTLALFDQVIYNEKGNCVTLIKNSIG